MAYEQQPRARPLLGVSRPVVPAGALLMCRKCRLYDVGQEVIDTTMIPPPLSAPPPPAPPPGGWPDPVATQPMPPIVEVAEEEWQRANSKPPKVLPRSYLKWLAVDLDGTLAEGIWTPEEPTSEIGAPIARNVEKARRLAEAGWKIVIHTARPWHDYESIEAWANWAKVPFKGIVCGKLLAAAYIDDRAINADDPDWTPRSHDARTA